MIKNNNTIKHAVNITLDFDLWVEAKSRYTNLSERINQLLMADMQMQPESITDDLVQLKNAFVISQQRANKYKEQVLELKNKQEKERKRRSSKDKGDWVSPEEIEDIDPMRRSMKYVSDGGVEGNE